MRIAQLVCSFPPYPGGMGQSAWRIGEILGKEHELTTFTLANLDIKNIENLSKQKIYYLKPLIRLGHGALPFSLLFSLKKYDIIYLHYPFFGVSEILKIFLIFSKKKKLIIHYHMDTSKLKGIKKILSISAKFSKKFLFKRANKILVSSLDYAKSGDLSKYIKENNPKIREIPFGVDIENFKPRISQKHPTPFLQKAVEFVNHVTRRIIKKGDYQLLFVGGLDKAHYFKGLSNLLQALSPLNKQNWRLNIIGDGDLKNHYQKISTELKLENKVKFRGRVSHEALIRYYQDSDILILPSINSHEAFGLVLIEALACGLPVIASDLPGVRGVFNHNKEGLLVKTNNILDLQEKIKYLLEHENIRENMSISARQLALKKYDQKIIADKILDEFSNL
jgi:glycosyltransferase involved in cell wall biosynthesis